MTMMEIIKLNRSEGIGSTDAKRIAENDWHALYLEKVGLREPDDLSGVFKVQLGIHTERFHLEWQAKRHGVAITYPEVRFYHAQHAFMFGHVDGWLTGADTFIEAKHSNGRAELREKAQYYMPQLQHMMAVTGRSFCHFSLIAGNNEPDWCIVERQDEYVEQLIGLEQSFWWHVENKVPPEITPTGKQAELARIVPAIPIDGRRNYDMSHNNVWCIEVPTYLDTKDAAERHEKAKKAIKDAVPDDAAECTGHGITVKRDKRGALRFA